MKLLNLFCLFTVKVTLAGIGASLDTLEQEFLRAALEGNLEKVRESLDPMNVHLSPLALQINPAVSDNLAFKEAALNGYKEIVELLIQHDQVDPSSSNNYALKWAARNGHADIVRLIISDRRVHPTLEDGTTALRWARLEGRDDIAQILLDSGKVQNAADPVLAPLEGFAAEYQLTGVQEAEMKTLHECSICFDAERGGKGLKTACRHHFHEECLSLWFAIKLRKEQHRDCPNCRKVFE